MPKGLENEGLLGQPTAFGRYNTTSKGGAGFDCVAASLTGLLPAVKGTRWSSIGLVLKGTRWSRNGPVLKFVWLILLRNEYFVGSSCTFYSRAEGC